MEAESYDPLDYHQLCHLNTANKVTLPEGGSWFY